MPSTEQPAHTAPLAWELEIIDLFVGIFETLGLPKSTARIYGWLYCSDDGRSQEELCSGLDISAGSASQGLRLLLRLGAVHRQSPEGQRLSLYTAERSMRRLVGTFLDQQLRPGLEDGRNRLEALKAQAESESAEQKIDGLLTWQKKAEKLLPLASTVLGVK